MPDEYPTVKAAAVQAAPVFLDREGSLEKAREKILEAGEAGADLTVFPEGFIPGHPLWYHFHGATSDKSNRLATRLFKNAVEVPGDVTEQLADAAANAGTYVTIGVCEKEPDTTGTMYNSQLFFSPDGEMIGKHQKIEPTVGERLVHNQGKRNTFGTVQTSFGPISGLICGENSNPLAAFALAAEQTRVHCMSWPPARMLTTRHIVMARAFAQMTKSFVVSANSVVSDRHLELMEIEANEAYSGPESKGGSIIVAPDMMVVSGPAETDREAILYADLDLELGVTKKITHDFAGHYNRRDMFQLRVNRDTPHLYTETSSANETSEEGDVEPAAVDPDGETLVADAGVDGQRSDE
jgi:aliphatic nitrilase